jgi:hypothetical protein
MSKPTRFDWLFRPHLADEDQPLSAEARFAEALAELPAVERSALALSEIGGLDTDEIAERLGTDPAVVQRLLSRARESVRASLSGRRGLAALLPLQNLWQLGSSAPAVRAAGVVAAAVVAPSVVTGGVAADAPRARAITAQPPAVRAVVDTRRSTFSAPRARITVARPAVATTPPEPAAEPRRRSVRPSVRPRPGRDDAAVPAQRPPQRAPVVPLVPAAQPERAAPPPEQPPERPRPAAATVPALPPPAAVELPVAPPLPVVPVPELPPLPPPPPVPLP